MIILKNAVITAGYQLKWNDRQVMYDMPNAQNTAPDLDIPPKFIVIFPAFHLDGNKASLVFKSKNVGMVARFELKKSGRAGWAVTDFETWYI